MHRNTGLYGNNSNMYAPIFQYVVDGRTYSRASGLSYNKGAAQKKLGKTVPVYYNVNAPQKASLSNGKGSRTGPVHRRYTVLCDWGCAIHS